MAGYKETPRQKMIAMMYLVLTALLALNVSKEILDAFLVVNESIEKTNAVFKAQIDGEYMEFEKQYRVQPGKVQKFYDLAMQVRKESDAMVAYIENIKAEVVSKTEGITIEEARKTNIKEVKRKNNFDVPTVYFITPKSEGGQEKAKDLKDEMAKYRAALISKFDDPKVREGLGANLGLKTDGDYRNRDNRPESWEMHHFYHTILAADITILNKIIAEVRNAESDVIAALFQNISKEDFTFDKIGAEVIAKSNYVLVGAPFEAKIFLAALDTKNPLRVRINGQEATGDSGVYNLTRVAGAEGPQKVQGDIIMKNRQTGVETIYPFTYDYIVARPAATVSATKMNVFYRGLTNPVSISVPGVSRDKIRPTITGGTLRAGGEAGWEVTVAEGSEAIINVAADIDGKITSMGSFRYRIKRLPKPVAKVSGQNVGAISRQRLIQAGVVTAELEDFLFEGISYTVTSFTFSTKGPDGLIKEARIQGRNLDANAINLIQRAREGQKVYFEDIAATGPSGRENLQPIILTIR